MDILTLMLAMRKSGGGGGGEVTREEFEALAAKVPWDEVRFDNVSEVGTAVVGSAIVA